MGGRWGGEKNMALWARFRKLKGVFYYQGGAEFSEGARFSRATMLFCKHVISVAAFLLIIHITMYILVPLI